MIGDLEIDKLRKVRFFDILRGVDLVLFKGRIAGYYFLNCLPYSDREIFLRSFDPCRYGAIKLAIDRIRVEKIQGSFAEVGVYKGYTSRIIHSFAPEKTLFLFDTFEGFPDRDLGSRSDDRWKDTTLELVKKNIGDLSNVVIRKGYFPESAKNLESERFSLVILDLDLYPSTIAGLKFFYERMSKGGFIFVHDYNNPGDPGAAQAVDEFIRDKPEMVVEIPDKNGSVIFRRM